MGAAPIAEPKPKRRSCLDPATPLQIRQEVSAFALAIGKRYRDQFRADPKLKQRTTRLVIRNLLAFCQRALPLCCRPESMCCFWNGALLLVGLVILK
jgi:hypothetical protein